MQLLNSIKFKLKSTLKKSLGFFARSILRIEPLRSSVLRIINKFPRIKTRLRKILFATPPVRTVEDLSSRGKSIYEEFKKYMNTSSRMH